MVVQDIQIRNILAKPEEAPKFCARKRERRDALVRKLNAVMHPLVSDNKEINGFHLEFADIATALNVNMKAYTGVYEPIYPSRGVEFNPECHAIERPEVRGPGFNPNALKGSPISRTVTVIISSSDFAQGFGIENGRSREPPT